MRLVMSETFYLIRIWKKNSNNYAMKITPPNVSFNAINLFLVISKCFLLKSKNNNNKKVTPFEIGSSTKITALND